MVRVSQSLSCGINEIKVLYTYMATFESWIFRVAFVVRATEQRYEILALACTNESDGLRSTGRGAVTVSSARLHTAAVENFIRAV